MYIAHSTNSPSSPAYHILVLETHVLYTVSASSRLLGTLSVSLQEAVSRGSQSLSSALKSKKGDIMQVG